MRKYYIVAEVADGLIHVRVVDALTAGRACLMEIQANSFAEASKMVTFSACGCGKTAICGVSGSGKPYASICD